MQPLIYGFIALGAVGVGAAGYFGLAFSIVEAVMAGVLFAVLALFFEERKQRNRAEIRLENAIEELSRLLSADAQAGGVLSQRVNGLVDQNAGHRLDVVEADVSVLGTVVRQLAEAVATLEQERRPVRTINSATSAIPTVPQAVTPEEDTFPDAERPELTADQVRKAIGEGRLHIHAEPLITLPQRRNYGYDLLARLQLEDGSLLDAPAFYPRQGNEPILRHIEAMAFQEALSAARAARGEGRTVRLFAPLSRATLADDVSVEQLAALLEANRPLLASLAFRIEAQDWAALGDREKANLQTLTRKGVGYSLADLGSLRLDMADLSAAGVRSVRVQAADFIDEPQTLTDLHAADVVPYLARFSIELIATGLANEQQILNLLDDAVGIVKGPHAGGPAPLRAEAADKAARRA